MRGNWDGGPVPSTSDDDEMWKRRLWWYVSVSLVVAAGTVLLEAFVMTKARFSGSLPTDMSSTLSTAIFQEVALSPVLPTTLLTDKASYRPEDVQFSWLPLPHAAGVAACDLVVEGFDMLVFDDKAAVNACLRYKSIVLVGDSVTRYQYLNLVNAIENGVWIGPDPQIENEFQWGGWPAFYQGTNARFNGREVCDCYRNPAHTRGNIENRYYYNEETDVRVSYFQWFGVDTGHLGHNMTWLNASMPASRNVGVVDSRDSQKGKEEEKAQRQRGASEPPAAPDNATHTIEGRQTGCLPGDCDQAPHWDYDIYGLLKNIVPLVQPDVVIFNHGLWPPRLPGDYDLLQLSQAAQEAVRASGGRAIYKTTTAIRDGGFTPEDDLKTFFQGEGISILDAANITSGVGVMEKHFQETQNTHLYWDNLHFYAPVYAGLNKVLLNYICPA